MLKPGFHYPSWRPELTARVDGWLVSITCQHGPCWRARVSTSRVDGPCWRVMETSHRSTRAVNSGRQLGQWKPGFRAGGGNCQWTLDNDGSHRLFEVASNREGSAAVRMNRMADRQTDGRTSMQYDTGHCKRRQTSVRDLKSRGPMR